MTRKNRYGTLSTIGVADKKKSPQPPKEADVTTKMKTLLGLNKVTFLNHANERMAERNVIYYEVLQALYNGKHDPKRDRYSDDHKAWEYSIEGKTCDQRALRIGIGFETTTRGELLLVITVIDPSKGWNL